MFHLYTRMCFRVLWARSVKDAANDKRNLLRDNRPLA